MQTKFSPSINIVRDFENEINYIPTSNSDRIFSQIIKDYVVGTRAFTIIGSYGSGKSAFLLALEQYLNGKEEYFKALNGEFRDNYQFEFMNIVGEYSSIVDTFANKLKTKNIIFSNKFIFKELDKYYNLLTDKNKCLVIVLDEFGKFLEFASNNNPERELYFIQQLAEYANDSKKNILFITVLHQSFDEYARNLKKVQRQEWEKVKGRLKEITFNEPVEQLLLLAAKRIENKNFQVPKNLKLVELLKTIQSSKVFPLRTELSIELAKKLYPFDILSAAILTHALQQYGQNERSLFTFLESDDYLGLKCFDKNNEPYYNLCSVYDYLSNNYSTLLTTKYNPHFFQWRAIQYSIDRIEATVDKNCVEAIKLVKIIGLLNIFARAGSIIDIEFLINYTNLSIGIKGVKPIITDLENKKIIRFLSYKKQFILFEGTDLDIENAIEQAATKVSELTDIITPLRYHFSFPYIVAKSVQYIFGTPRFFQFYFSDNPIEKKPEGQIDGIINLIFTEKLNKENVIEYSRKINEAILFGVYQNTERIKNVLFEIRKTNYVIENIVDDRVAQRELKNILEFQKQKLNQHVLNKLYESSNDIDWIYNGQEIDIINRARFNQILSEICEKVYFKTPVFKNELINREKIPSAISKARKNLIEALINNWDKEDLGFRRDEFPPEKSIYLALLKNTGIHRKNGEGYILGEPTELSFKPLWEASEAFLYSTKVVRKNLNEFLEILNSKPFKLKKGLIDFWIPIYLFVRRNDYALFSENRFIPELNSDVFDLIVKKPKNFYLKAFNIDGVKLDLFNKYRSFLKQKYKNKITHKSFIETIKPFLTFYQTLPEYSKITHKLSKDALSIKEAILKSTDPEKTFFEDFPTALGYSLIKLNDSKKALEDFFIQLQNTIQEIRICYDGLIDRVEKFIFHEFEIDKYNYPDYKKEIQNRFVSIKKYLLLPHQLNFLSSINSSLNDKSAWISSITQSLLGKSLEKINDDEEEMLFKQMSKIRLELDNFTEFSKLNIDIKKEDLIKIEITSLSKGRNEKTIRIPKIKSKQKNELNKKIKNVLSSDRTTNIEILLNILNEQLKNEKN
jgi:hypothetical protein